MQEGWHCEGDKILWREIEKLHWGESPDYERIRLEIEPTKREELKQFVEMREHALEQVVWLYIKQIDYPDQISTDGMGDCVSHIIGLGQRFYERALANPVLIIDRYEEHNYIEKFSYAFAEI